MHEESIAIWVIGVAELLLLASLSAVVLRRVRFPYTIGLVIVGLLVAIAQDRLHVLTPIQHIRLRPDVVLYLFLPTLVFPAAVQLDLRLVRQNLAPILLLAGPGVILSTVIVGGVVGALTPLSWGAALLFGLSNRYARAEPIDWRFQAIMFWGGGLRGALPLVMALSLPLAVEQRQLILDLTAGVVLFTLLVQGTTMGRLIRACGLS